MPAPRRQPPRRAHHGVARLTDTTLARAFRRRAAPPPPPRSALADLMGAVREWLPRPREERVDEPPTDAGASGPPAWGGGPLAQRGDRGGLGVGRRRRVLRLPPALAPWLPARRTVLLAGLGLGGLWLGRHAVRTMPLRDHERALVVTAADVARATGAFSVEREHESFVKERTLLGDVTLAYRYEPPGEHAPRVSTTTRVLHDEGAARDAFRWTAVRTALEWKLGGDSVGLVHLDDALLWGDESRAFLVVEDGLPVGHAFAGRAGRRTVQVSVRGAACPDGASFADLLAPVLERVAAYRP